MVTVQQVIFQQVRQDNRHATDLVEVVHVEFTVGLHVRQVRHAFGNPVEVIKL
jgi:hypothetical protein